MARLRFYCLADPLCVDISRPYEVIWVKLCRQTCVFARILALSAATCIETTTTRKKILKCNNKYFRLRSANPCGCAGFAHLFRPHFSPPSCHSHTAPQRRRLYATHVPSHRGGSGRAWSNNMPESCGGRDGEEERRHRGNIVSAISQFADENLTFVRVRGALSPTLQLLG